MKRADIIPAILPKDFAELSEKIELIRSSVKFVQIDVCDGQFTPDATWPYRKDDDSFQKILKEEEGLPGWQELNYEIDLMANSPEGLVEEWVSAGASRIIIHAESKSRGLAEGEAVAKAIEILKGRVEVGLALNVTTPIALIQDPRFKIQEGAVDFIQLMGIDHIGFQGQEFDAKVIDRIKEVKALYPDMVVSIDGGVSLETAPLLISAGADRLVIGSAIFNADNYMEALAQFKGMKV
jgi:ribulose-phosphate 3-epimerase